MSLRNLLHPVLPQFDTTTYGGSEIEILQEIPVETLYLALKEADTETSLWLFQNARPEQIQGLLDLDCWTGDKFMPERFDPYFRTFAMMPPLKLQEYMKWLDPEIIVRGLMEYGQVVDFDPQNPPDGQEAQMLLTLDSKYAILLKDASPDIREALYLWLNKFSAVDMGLLHRHLESCKWEQLSDLEEFAFKIKKGRLEDMGFVDRDEAISLYAVGSSAETKKHILENPLPPNTKREAAGQRQQSPEETEPSELAYEFLPEIIKESTNDGAFFAEAYQGLDTKALKELVMMEVVRTVNSALMADEALHLDLPQIQELTDKYKNILNIGLSYLAEQKSGQSTKILESTPVTSIFKVGWQIIYDLTKASSQIQKNLSLEFWPSLDKEFLEGLKGRHPQLSPHLMLDLGCQANAPFLRIETLFLCGQRLKQLALLSEFFFQKMGPALRILEKPKEFQDNVFSRITTGLYREASGKDFDSREISLSEWAEDVKTFSPEKMSKSSRIIVSRMPDLCQTLCQKRLQDYVEEIGEHVTRFREKGLLPQPRFTRSLLLVD